MSLTGGMTDGKALKEVVFDGMSLPPFKPLREGVEARLNAIKHLETRPTDILLAIYPKSGTHWVWEIVWMLLNGRAEYIKEGKESLFLEAMDDIGTVSSMDSPRVLNTNLPFRWLPQKHVESNGKIIHVIRNPKDICVSLYYHFIGSGLFMHSEGVQFADCFEGLFSKERKPPYGGWFSYEKDFEEAVSKNYNIHILHFENLKRNTMVEIQRLAEFLEVPHSTKLLHEISDSCSFNKLKKADDTLKEKSKYKKIVVGANPKFEGDVDKVQYNSFFRKGEIGDWKNHFTVRQNERFDEMYKKQMVDSKLKVYFE